MNPFKIIRWKVLIILGVLGYGAHYFAFDRYLDRLVTQRLEEQFKSKTTVDSVKLSIVDGTMEVRGVYVEDPIDRTKYLLKAESARLEVDPLSFLTRRVVARKIHLHKPEFAAQRPSDSDEDVSAWDLEDLDPKEVMDRAKDIYGKYEKARDTWGKIRDTLARLKAKRELEAERSGQLEILRGVTELPELGPRLVIEQVTVDGIGISFDAISAKLPRLLDGKIEAKNITSKPEWSKFPLALIAGAKLDDAVQGPAFGLQALLGANSEKLNLSGLFERLDVQRIKEFVQDSLPVELIDGRISATWNGHFNGLDSLDMRPILVFENLKIRAKPDIANLGGFLAGDLSKEICECGTFALTDLRIHGDLFNPQFELGDTLKKLMQIGGKAFAEQYGKKMVESLLGQISGRIPGAEGLVGLPLALLRGDNINFDQALTTGLGSVLNMSSTSVGGQSFDKTFGDLMKGGAGGVLGGASGAGVPDLLQGILGGAKPADPAKSTPETPGNPVEGILKGIIDPAKPKDDGKTPTPGLPGAVQDLFKSKPKEKPTSQPADRR